MREPEACLPPELVGPGVVVLARVRRTSFAGARAAAPPPLGDIYQQMRTGALDRASAGGEYAFGLALLAESAAPR